MIDIESAFSNISTGDLETKLGLVKYTEIMELVKKKPFSATPEFRKRFNGYYRIRQRTAAWYDKYYSMLERQLYEDRSFESLLREMYEFSGRIEVSFVSKLVATANPSMPIWDRYVIYNLGLEKEWKRTTGWTKEQRIQKAIEIYNQIVCWYSNFMGSEAGINFINLFDYKLPKYAKSVSKTKKIDCILWKSR